MIQLLHNMCKDPQTMVDIYVNYDCDLKHIDIFAKMSAQNPKPEIRIPKPAKMSIQNLNFQIRKPEPESWTPKLTLTTTATSSTSTSLPGCQPETLDHTL